MGVDDEVVEFGIFAGKDEGSGVGSVESGVEGGGLFAFGSFGACGFEGVLAGCVFAFVVGLHVGTRIAGGFQGGLGKWFGMSVEWGVTQRLMAADLRRCTLITQKTIDLRILGF